MTIAGFASCAQASSTGSLVNGRPGLVLSSIWGVTSEFNNFNSKICHGSVANHTLHGLTCNPWCLLIRRIYINALLKTTHSGKIEFNIMNICWWCSRGDSVKELHEHCMTDCMEYDLYTCIKAISGMKWVSKGIYSTSKKAPAKNAWALATGIELASNSKYAFDTFATISEDEFRYLVCE